MDEKKKALLDIIQEDLKIVQEKIEKYSDYKYKMRGLSVPLLGLATSYLLNIDCNKKGEIAALIAHTILSIVLLYFQERLIDNSIKSLGGLAASLNKSRNSILREFDQEETIVITCKRITREFARRNIPVVMRESSKITFEEFFDLKKQAPSLYNSFFVFLLGIYLTFLTIVYLYNRFQ